MSLVPTPEFSLVNWIYDWLGERRSRKQQKLAVPRPNQPFTEEEWTRYGRYRVRLSQYKNEVLSSSIDKLEEEGRYDALRMLMSGRD